MCQPRDDRKESLNYSEICCTDLCNVTNTLKLILIDLEIPETALRKNTLLHKNLQLDSVEIVELALGLKRKLGVNSEARSVEYNVGLGRQYCRPCDRIPTKINTSRRD